MMRFLSPNAVSNRRFGMDWRNRRPEAKKPVPGQNGRERLWACCVGGGVGGTMFPECLTGVQRSAPILYLIYLYQKAIFFFKSHFSDEVTEA